MTGASRAQSYDLASAIAACRLQGAQITPLRERVLGILWKAAHPLGAYEIRKELSQLEGRNISAPTIYRTLEFLGAHGAVHRIESRNAFVACRHPQSEQACILFVCDSCGLSSEIRNRKFERLLEADARSLGFAIDHRVLELSGSCVDCRG